MARPLLRRSQTMDAAGLNDATLIIDGNSKDMLNSTLHITGNATWTEPADGSCINMWESSTIAIQGTLHIDGSPRILQPIPTHQCEVVILAGGAITRSGTGLFLIEPAVTSDGLLDVSSGVVWFDKGFTQFSGVTRLASNADVFLGPLTWF